MPRLTRAGALLAVPVLVLGALPAPTAGAAQAQADDAAAHLVRNLEGGLLTYESFGPYTDFGGSIDAAIALDAVGGHDAEVTAVGNAVSSRLSDYTDYTYTQAGSTYAGRAAGATAKAVVALQNADINPRTHPDGDLVQRLEGLVGTDGRIADQATKDGVTDPTGDYANTFGQTFAVTALHRAGSSRAAAATTFLRGQQCDADGYFTESFVTPGTACDSAADASVDATALAVSTFVPLPSAASGNNYVFYRALGYLQNAQRSNGGFGATAGAAPNANSTGLAVAALRQMATIDLSFEQYAGPLAERGAAWLRARQLDNVGSCTPYAAAELGAVAYDDAARDAAVTDGITVATEGQFLKATAQSAEGLLSAPAGPTVLRARATAAYVADGSTQTVQLAGAAPGSPICLSTGLVQKSTSVTGAVGFSVRLPAGTGNRTYTFTGVDGVPARAVIKALGAKTLGLRLRSSVRRGASQRVIVTGLAPREKVSVRYGGRTVRTGTADSRGVLDTTFTISSATAPGTRAVTVYGQFTDRKATRSFSVTR